MTKNIPAFLLVLIALAAGGCRGFSAMLKGGPPKGLQVPEAAASQPAAGETSGEGGLAHVLRERPPVPVTTPSYARFKKKPKPDLPASGSGVIDRRCRAERHAATGWYQLKFLTRQGRRYEMPRWILPCDWLEEIEKIVADDPQTVLRVTGETTVYKGRVFILLHSVTIDS
ncbi:MAG: hypothetical protein KAU28_05065, partial [Phycisphaerae bacterium]|nr:hypothetical protein [Phycisphaerae bacterium]